MFERYEKIKQFWLKNLWEAHKRGKLLNMNFKIIIVDEIWIIRDNKNIKDDFDRLLSWSRKFWRACWFHILGSTQDPTVEELWRIKPHLTTRIALKMPDAWKSRNILDKVGWKT